MDPAGAFLYVANAGSNNISVFSIDSSTGKLTPVAGSPFFLGLSPPTMQLMPSGNFLYVSVASDASWIDRRLWRKRRKAPKDHVTPTDTFNPQALAIDPSGEYLYVANLGSSGSSISIFTIDSSGVLKDCSRLSARRHLYRSVCVDPEFHRAVPLRGESGLQQRRSIFDYFHGLPVALTTSTSTFAFVTHTDPSFLAADPSGNYLFVGNQGSAAGIQAFGVSSGNLNPLSTYNVGNTPTSIAVLK